MSDNAERPDEYYANIWNFPKSCVSCIISTAASIEYSSLHILLWFLISFEHSNCRLPKFRHQQTTYTKFSAIRPHSISEITTRHLHISAKLSGYSSRSFNTHAHISAHTPNQSRETLFDENLIGPALDRTRRVTGFRPCTHRHAHTHMTFRMRIYLQYK